MTYANGKIGIGWNHTIKRSSNTRIGFGMTVKHASLLGFYAFVLPNFRKNLCIVWITLWIISKKSGF